MEGSAFTIARRELRTGVLGFRIFLICLVLGVAAIAAVRSISTGILESLAEDGRIILGGDLALNQLYRPLEPELIARLEAAGRLSHLATLRAMTRTEAASLLVELKAVDEAYPLFGSLTLEDDMSKRDALAVRPDPGTGAPVHGAIFDPVVLARLGLAPGETFAIGEAVFSARAALIREPDRAGSGLAFAPRVMISRAALEATELEQPASLIRYRVRVALTDPGGAEGLVAALTADTPDAGWRILSHDDASPQLRRLISRITLHLTLVGLTALLVGGVGVSNAVRAFLNTKTATIATLKCLGATSGTVFAAYLSQVMALALLGTAIGLVIGAAAPWFLGTLLNDLLPIDIHMDIRIGLYPAALALAAGFGLLTAATFALWPLGRAQSTQAGALFRDVVAPGRTRPPPAIVAAVMVAALVLAAMAVATAEDRFIAAIFVAGAAATLALFRLVAWGVMVGARRLARPPWPTLRLAISNIHRPGAPTAAVMLSLGLGLTVLVTVALIESNLTRQLRDEIPAAAPSFFLFDVQKDQMAEVADLVAAREPAEILRAAPFLRGWIVAVDGVPAEEIEVAEEDSWILRGDRGVTYRRERLDKDVLVDGAWWPADYDGPPLVSLYDEAAAALGVGVGDTLTINVLGRDIEAGIANTRTIDWQSVEINFIMVLSPGVLDAAPHTYLVTLGAPTERELEIQNVLAQAYPNISAVRVQEIVDQFDDVIGQMALAVRGTAAIALVAGILVLAGAVAAGHARRVYDSVVLKVLGATRRDVLIAFLVEHGLLGLLAALVAAAIGTAAAWGVIHFVFDFGWTFAPGAVLTTVAGAVTVTLAFGFVGTWKALGQKAAPLLRND